MIETWKEICFELKDCIQNNVLEKEYERTISNCMGLLGWKKFRGEIITQYPVQAGHETKLADIVILQDNIEQFVVEVKRPNHLMLEEDERQLFSYMRLLKKQVKFGLYIGDKIHLYYDDALSQQLPEQVFTIDIDENDSNGIKFVELFSKESFNAQTLNDFCKEQKIKLQEQKQIPIEVEKLLSDAKGQLFKDLLKEKYLKEGRSAEWADTVLQQIDLNVSSLNRLAPNVKPLPKVAATYTPTQRKVEYDRTRYSLLGSRPLSKRRFVLEVITKFVIENPSVYIEYCNILNAIKLDSMDLIRTYEDVLLKNQTDRYFTKEDERLVSSDGITFVVCGEWGIFNIKPVVDFARRQGYDVVEYK